MAWVSVKMISLGSLLFFSDRISTAHNSKCVSAGDLRSRQRFLTRYNPSFPKSPPRSRAYGENKRTCAEAIQQLRDDVSARSVSPWKFRLDRDENRFPRDIAVAECLCQGCILNWHEDLDYNSVPIMVSVMVLRKSRCPTDKDKYVLTKETMKVPVACTCVVPNTAG